MKRLYATKNWMTPYSRVQKFLSKSMVLCTYLN